MGQPGGNLEQRLNKLDQKLDQILQELREMRGGKAPKAVLPRGPGGSSGVPSTVPGASPRIGPEPPAPPAPPRVNPPRSYD
jgi:hypothetical protein